MASLNTNGIYKTRPVPKDELAPHNFDAERSVIGALLIDPDGFIVIGLMGLKASDFYIGNHQLIFEAMDSLNRRGMALDIVTVSEELERMGKLKAVGGGPILSQLIVDTPTSVHLRHYAEIVRLHSVRRQVIKAAAQMTKMAYSTGETDPNAILSAAGETLLSVQTDAQRNSGIGAELAVNRFLDRLETLQNIENGIIGIPTGLSQLDYFTQGLQQSQFIILAAPPGAGKTSLAVQLASVAAGKHDKRVLIISAEMTALSLMTRIVSAESAVDSAKMKAGTLNRAEYQRVVQTSTQVAGWPLTIDDKTRNIDAITAQAIMMAAREGLDLVVVDYIQRLDAGLSRQAQKWECISHIGKKLKDLANAVSVPVLAISSILEKQIAGRGDKRPERADLTGSGDLAFDADQIWFLHTDDESSVTEIIIDKNREGRVGTANVFFKKELTKFEPIEVRVVNYSQI